MNPKLGPVEPDKVFIHGLTEKITRDQLELNLEELMEVEVKDVVYGLDPSIAMVVYNAAAGDKHKTNLSRTMLRHVVQLLRLTIFPSPILLH